MSEPEATTDEKVRRRPLKCRCHGRFAAWLAASGGSLAVSTYTSGKAVLAVAESNKLTFRSYKVPRPLGMARNGRRLAIATREQILTWQLSDEASHETFLFKHAFATGKVNVHDLAYGRRGLYFANTRFNGIARTSTDKRFVHCWSPPFISSLVPQDRCHLNGIGMRRGQVAMATAFCETDEKNDWRKEDRLTSGVLLDVKQNRIVARGLCMPHSPRRYRGQWWLCNSGHGSLNRFDAATGTCPELCALPGFTRGLCFVGPWALVGLSKIRPKHVLDAPPVRQRFEYLVAGVALVDGRTGRQVGLLEFVEGGNEVFEVLFLRGLRSPRLELSEKSGAE